MKLYYAPNTCALACWIALEWAGADYKVERADYSSAEYQRINPLAAVPALDIGKERAMTQATAILNYIAKSYPEANLGSDDDLYSAFVLDEIMSFLASDLHPAFWPYFVPMRFSTDDNPEAIEKVREASFARIDRAMQYLDNLIGDGEYVYQNRRSIADAYAYVMVCWTANLEKSWQHYPNVARFMQRMQKDPAVQQVFATQEK